MGSGSAERFSGSVKTLHSRDQCASSLDRAKCFALKKNTCENSYIVLQKSLVYEASVSVGFKCTNKFCVSCDLCTLHTCLFARAVDLFVYGHSLLHSLTHFYMHDDIVGRTL